MFILNVWKVMGKSFLKMVVNIKEILRMVYLNKMVYFNGQMV
jgi:hypothetical protein